MTPMKIAQLQKLATDMVGDDRKPDLFFVTVKGVVITITRNMKLAYDEWKQLALRNIESTLENRQFGILCSADKCPAGNLIISDAMHMFRPRD